MPARQSGSPRQQCSGAISAFVDSIDSHIILRMIRESKMMSYVTEQEVKLKMHALQFQQRGKTSDWSIFAGKPPMINQ